MKFKPYDQSQIMLLPPDIQEMIPDNHVVRAINLVVEQLDMRKMYESYSEEGQPGYHPKILLKILLYGYSIGVRSSRKLSQRTGSDIYFMYLTAMQRPDFRTISDFRKLKGEYLQEYFVQILVICKKLGMLSLGHISIDGSKIKSNSSKASLKTKEVLDENEKNLRKKVKEIFDNAESIDRTEDQEYGTTKRGDELPEEIGDENKLLEKILEAKKEIEEKNLKRVSMTDKDSRLMLMSNGGYDMGYNAQISVDSDNQIILSCDVVNNTNDYGQFEGMYEQVITNITQKPEEVSADAGYSSGKTLNYIKENQIDAYIPDGRMNNEVNKVTGEEQIKKYDRRNFKYDHDSNRYICPEGKSMVFERNSERKKVKYKIYRGVECSSCLKRTQCISKQHQSKASYREILIYENDDIKAELRKKLLSYEGKRKFRKRLSVESVFAHIKHTMGFKQFLLRGIKKVKTEFSLMCISHNIKKLRPVMLTG